MKVDRSASIQQIYTAMPMYHESDRRVHRVYVTRNTEYHIRRDTCVGVRDISTGRWLGAHMALNRKLCGGLRFGEKGVEPNSGEPDVGESLYFQSSGQDLVTSIVTEVQRPPKEVVATYTL
ncbi:MAG: hypothetical protein IPJ88_09525 [Myxococcales bacterium]|nr:MAG: hypothetical protein IPJ88_09525 [Myxococcales bacterium]